MGLNGLPAINREFNPEPGILQKNEHINKNTVYLSVCIYIYIYIYISLSLSSLSFSISGVYIYIYIIYQTIHYVVGHVAVCK